MSSIPMNNPPMDPARRNILAGTAVVGGLAGLAAVWPFAASMFPSERAKALGAPVEVDISGLEPGKQITVEWQGKVVWVLRRTQEMLKGIDASEPLLADPTSASNQQPEYAKNKYRSIKPEYLVAVGICTHLGCSPTLRPDLADGAGAYFCPCHGSKFDLAGRVYKGVPAPTNLVVPKHAFLSDTRILVGDDNKGA